MSPGERARLIDNTARRIGTVDERIQYRHAAHCLLADEEYGRRMAEALGLSMCRVRQLSRLSNDELIAATRLSCCSAEGPA